MAHAALIAPFGAAAAVVSVHACHTAKGFPLQLDSFAWAHAVTTAALLGCYLLVEELARGRSRRSALAMFGAFLVVHALLLHAVFDALSMHVSQGTAHRGGWPVLDVWMSVVDQLKRSWSGGDLRVPIFLTGSPLMGLAVARGFLRLPGWAQPLVVVTVALVGGAIFGALLASACGYPREAWGAVIASSAVLQVPAWAAVPLGLRVGDRVAPWIVARVTADLARRRSST